MSASDDIKKALKALESMKKEVEKDLIDVGEEAVNLIKKRTRLGYGVADQGGAKTKLDKLSTGYIAQRKRNKPKGPSTPSKSNLTNTGDMLDALEAKEKADNKVEIGFKTTKEEQKAEWVSEDRPFNNLSKAEIKQLKKKLENSIKEAIKKIN